MTVCCSLAADTDGATGDDTDVSESAGVGGCIAGPLLRSTVSDGCPLCVSSQLSQVNLSQIKSKFYLFRVHKIGSMVFCIKP